MRFSELLNDPFQLLVRVEQILVSSVHLGGQTYDLLIRLLYQSASCLQTFLPTFDTVNNLFKVVLDLIVSLLPFCHFG